ncbi:MAG: hypothetical protein HRF43_01070 [Phycisphaerae bacterium]|jgi:hypothetical protein
MLSLLLVGSMARAQAPAAPPPAPLTGPTVANAPEPNWDVIRKAPLTPIDKSTVQKWVAAYVNQIFTASDPMPYALYLFRRTGEEVRNTASVPAYKDALAQTVTDAFNARYGQTPPASQPVGIVFLLMTIRQLAPSAAANYGGALIAFQSVLADPSSAVRSEGLAGLQQIRAAIPAAGRPAVINAVQKAGLAEVHPVVLGRMYTFLAALGDNGTPQDVQAVVTALLAILDARLTRIEQKREWPFSADATAVAWLAGKSRTLTVPATQTAIARTTARLLADVVYAHVHHVPSAAIKEDLERAAMLAEEQLTALYKAKLPNGPVPEPSVTKAIHETGAKQGPAMTAAVEKWIGSGSTPGVLNPPAAFGLPVGLGITRPPPPATSSAPSS